MTADTERPSNDISHFTELAGPASELHWSADFVMQAIEVLPVMLKDGRIMSLRPQHADSFVVGWPAGDKPEVVTARTIEWLGLTPVVLHSTSWRHSGSEVVLTYLVVVAPTDTLPESWMATPVGHVELARGDTTTPPPTIAVDQVLEHVLRHLTWLLHDDEIIARALSEWPPHLADYVPEPFRALGGPPGV